MNEDKGEDQILEIEKKLIINFGMPIVFIENK